jgi:ubiquinone/menaquinone biosynthesis C-methylase UbiE
MEEKRSISWLRQDGARSGANPTPLAARDRRLAVSSSKMASRLRPITRETLRRLHARGLEQPQAIGSLLERVRTEAVLLVGRRTAAGDAESATLTEIGSDALIFRAVNFGQMPGESIFLNFQVDGRLYFFAAPRLEARGDQLRTEFPTVIYEAERRDHLRLDNGSDLGAPTMVSIRGNGRTIEARVADYSLGGMGIEIPSREVGAVDSNALVYFLDGASAGSERYARVRHRTGADRSGWVRLGLTVSEVPIGEPLPVDRREEILKANPVKKLTDRATMVAAGARLASTRVASTLLGRPRHQPSIEIAELVNSSGERIRGIINSTRDPRGGTAVLIPPAWGRTKETLLPLAQTLVETFDRARKSLTVLRFDGIRRRGESFNDLECLVPGREGLHFTLSQAIADIRCSAQFLAEDPRFQASRIILVTFSAASIEGRRAVLLEQGRHIHGWISVVGASDLQSGIRTVSGGIDYVAGADQGLKFGIQEIMGVATDVDFLLADAIEQRLASLEDARRDLSGVNVPLTWIHGGNDAWLDLERVQAIMGCGDTAERCLLEVPTGHQLKSSKEALEVFQLIAVETAKMALGSSIPPQLPDLVALEERRRAERARIPRRALDPRAFWRNYLLGREGGLGIELMNATSAYSELMDAQIELLGLRDGDHVADLGCGTGALPIQLSRADSLRGLVVEEIDFVPEALKRVRTRLESLGTPPVQTRYRVCDFDRQRDLLKLPSDSYDAVLASLVIGYVADAEKLLAAAYRMLRKGGRLVLSNLRPDADTSKLYLEGIDELRAGRAREHFGAAAERGLDESARRFLNDAARILDLEEDGTFRFWDEIELRRLVERAGFTEVSTRESFGTPPQAFIVFAKKPDQTTRC